MWSIKIWQIQKKTDFRNDVESYLRIVWKHRNASVELINIIAKHKPIVSSAWNGHGIELHILRLLFWKSHSHLQKYLILIFTNGKYVLQIVLETKTSAGLPKHKTWTLLVYITLYKLI